MTEKRNAFRRVFDAVVESRMRHAEHQVDAYRRMFDMDIDRKANR